MSKRRQKFLQKELLNYNLKEALEVICDQFIYDKKYDEICEAEKEILNLSKYYYDEEYWDERNERIAEEEIEGDLKLTETEKESLILARRGQGKFRKNVLERTKFCPFTGISNPALLIASHIKPWKVSNNNEKLDGNNGFAFTPTYDRLFDQGYISFGDNKNLMVSKKLDNQTIDKLGLKNGEIIEQLNLSEKSKLGLATDLDLVYSCLDLRPKNLDHIIRKTGFSPGKTAGILGQLILMGLVKETGRQYYIRLE